MEGVEHAVILNRRSQLGRQPFHRIGLGHDLIDVIAIDALKRALLESDPEGLDARQDHSPQAFGTGIGLNCYAAWIKQDCKGWHDAHLNQGGSVTELSVTDRGRGWAVMETPWSSDCRGAVPFCSSSKKLTNETTAKI
jgi:hypothetical protein